MGKILDVTTSANFLVSVRFDNNHSVTLDMKSKLVTVRFSELADEEVFKAATTDGKSILWPGGISMAISEIMAIVTKYK